MDLPANPSETDIAVEKLKLEERQVEIEERKARQGFWTRLGIVLPLIVAVAAFGGDLLVQRLEAHDALESEKRQAKDAFELKVAELIMDSSGPYETRGRAVALSQLFPNSIPRRAAMHGGMKSVRIWLSSVDAVSLWCLRAR